MSEPKKQRQTEPCEIKAQPSLHIKFYGHQGYIQTLSQKKQTKKKMYYRLGYGQSYEGILLTSLFPKCL